jgi:hypothetical protein
MASFKNPKTGEIVTVNSNELKYIFSGTKNPAHKNIMIGLTSGNLVPLDRDATNWANQNSWLANRIQEKTKEREAQLPQGLTAEELLRQNVENQIGPLTDLAGESILNPDGTLPAWATSVTPESIAGTLKTELSPFLTSIKDAQSAAKTGYGTAQEDINALRRESQSTETSPFAKAQMDLVNLQKLRGIDTAT